MVVQVTVTLQQVDRDAYDWFMSGMIHRTSEAWGVPHALGEVKQKLASGDVQGAIGALRPIETWADGMEHIASGERLKARIEYVM